MGRAGFRPPCKSQAACVRYVRGCMRSSCAPGTKRGMRRGGGTLLSGDGSSPASAVANGHRHRSRPNPVSALRRAALHARPHRRQLRLKRRRSARAMARWPRPTGRRRLACALLGRVAVAACRTPRDRKLVRLRGSVARYVRRARRALWFLLDGDQLPVVGLTAVAQDVRVRVRDPHGPSSPRQPHLVRMGCRVLGCAGVRGFASLRRSFGRSAPVPDALATSCGRRALRDPRCHRSERNRIDHPVRRICDARPDGAQVQPVLICVKRDRLRSSLDFYLHAWASP
jgi:hypothetical protein